MGDQRLPPGAVALSPGFRSGSEALPALVLDLDHCAVVPAGAEPDPHVSGIVGLAAQIPRVAEQRRRFPPRHPPPLVLASIPSSLEYPPPYPAFEDDRCGIAANGVVGRPPLS